MKLSLAIVAVLTAACGSNGETPIDAGPPDAAGGMPLLLSQTGLYSDIATKTIAADLVAFTPAHPLWSDGAMKRRWVRLPAGAKVDTSDLDHWRLPVGTQFWKEFALDGVLLETRLVQHVSDTGQDEIDYQLGAYVWLPDGSDAILTPAGASNVNGTAHDVPTATQCWACHIGEPGHALGFSRVQLSQPDPAVNTQWLAAHDLVTDPPPVDIYAVPGDATTAAALGTLHANCGHCHNPHGIAWPDSQQVLRLGASERDPETTALWQSTVGVRLQSYVKPPFHFRIVAGDPDGSAVFYRMTQRGTTDAMPPLATELVDDDGVAAVRAWIAGLPPQ